MAINASPKSAPPYKQQTLAIMAETNTFKMLDIRQTLEKNSRSSSFGKEQISVTAAIFVRT